MKLVMKKLGFHIACCFLICWSIGSNAQTVTKVIIPGMNEMIETGLANNYDIKINHHMVEISKGEMKSYKGAFDPELGVDYTTSYGISTDAESKDPTNADLYLYVPTKLGVDVTTGLSYFRQYDLTQNSQSEIANGAWLQVDIPLLKGLGNSNQNLINYEISKLKLETTKIDFDYKVTALIKDIVLSYTKVFSQFQLYKSQESIIENFGEYKSDIEQKIDKQIIPAAESINVNAEMAQLKSEENTIFDDLKSDYLDLMKLVGEDAEIKNVKEFQVLFLMPEINSNEIQEYVDGVLNNLDEVAKQSLLVGKQESEKERVRNELYATKLNLRNDLDLKLKYNYYSEEINGAWNNYLIFQNSTYPGSSYEATLTYRLPFRNNVAKGRFMAKQEEYQLEQEYYNKLIFELKKDIENVAVSLLNSLDVYTMQKEISDLRGKAYANEKLKYRNGNSTQLDVLTAHRTFTQALLKVHSMEFGVVYNLVMLKFLCTQIPKNSEELSGFNVFNLD